MWIMYISGMGDEAEHSDVLLALAHVLKIFAQANGV